MGSSSLTPSSRFPQLSLVFQVHPGARGRGIETHSSWELKPYGDTQPERCLVDAYHCGTAIMRARQSERALLEDVLFKPQPWRDLRMICSLNITVQEATLPPGFVLRLGISEKELERYQDLHRVVFDGVSMGFDYHRSRAYQPELDLIAVNPDGTFVAFCLCRLKQVADSSGEYSVGEVGVIGTRPGYQKLGLGRALLLSGMQRLMEHGGKSVFLETEDGGTAALHLFMLTGFRTVSAWRWFTKDV